ncbi:MAG: D-aminoacyl-tRNA deacylase [Nanoarchaeota archaeon]
MKFTIIISEKDPAGLNIFESLTETYPNIENKTRIKLRDNTVLIKIKDETLYADHIDTNVESDIIIFATRHQSKQGKPCFCVHTPGNWADSLYGGKPRDLCISPASLQASAFKALKKHNTLEGFGTYLEATHHGPILHNKPSIFIEIGSSKREWNNKKAGEIIAKTLSEIITKPFSEKRPVIGIGGPHYCDNISKINAMDEYAVGHVCPKYMLPRLDTEMINMAISRTYEKEPLVVLDWKGLGQHKKHVQNVLKEAEIEYKKIKELY